MSEILTSARRSLSIGDDLGHGCAMAALKEAFAEIDRLTARIDDLLNANNGEVERRRRAESLWRWPANGKCFDCDYGPCYMNCSNAVLR